jgi:CRP-like cAMP-binding protein
MYGKPRAATIRAETDGTLWGIGRVAFRNIVMQKSGGLHTTKDLLDTLRGVHVFAGASFPQLQRICAMAVEERYADGKVIVDKSSLPVCAKLNVRWRSLRWLHRTFNTRCA